MKTISILGCTGSIGTQSLEVAQKNGFQIKALAAGKNAALAENQARKFKPETVAMFDEDSAKQLKIALADTNIKVLSGESGVCEAAAAECDTVVNAIVGIAGLKPTLCAIGSGNGIALANKETLVTGGEIVNRKAKEKGVQIIPVDSEHSAIFQCLQGAPKGSLKKILLTASGGPFYGKTREDLEKVTVAQALRHPNWLMGAKITIDSATLMNKGLEVIEAVHLFGVRASNIEVLVHRQSILHSAVELTDGAVIAQLGTPDMRLPIAYALTFPERPKTAFERLNLFETGSLTFEKPDTDTFRCLSVCINAINEGGLLPAAVNGANEEAVKLFLAGKIHFLQIGELVETVYTQFQNKKDFTVEDIFLADKFARAAVKNNSLIV